MFQVFGGLFFIMSHDRSMTFTLELKSKKLTERKKKKRGGIHIRPL